jgi:hypothetical protein
MELTDAVQKALHILEEERVRPTLGYRYVAREWPPETRWEESQLRSQGYTPSMAALIGLSRMRKRRPREVYENPRLFVFESVNFNLLLIILNQLTPHDRPAFISALLKMVPAAPIGRKEGPQATFPSWHGYTSSLALLAEFCVRTGHLRSLLAATSEAEMPKPGLVVMLLELEEIIALNFNVFSDRDLGNMPKLLSHLREIAERQTYSVKRPRGAIRGPVVENPHYRQGFKDEGEEIVKAIDAIREQCRQARYWYLKGALQQTTNLEIESDKAKVVEFLDSLGFDPLLTASLKRAEDLYQESSDAFDLKSCLGHIRSFYEHLHIDAATVIANESGDAALQEWDPALNLLRSKSFLSTQQEKFARALYTLLSHEGVHPLIADREFARLLRNMVIEYGLMFLTMLEKKGVRIRT